MADQGNGISALVGDQSSAAASLARRLSTAEGSRPETADAAGAVAAAEMVQLESLVTMGDGKHDVFTCHCWGLEGTIWAANEPGQLVREGKLGAANPSQKRLYCYRNTRHTRSF